MEQGQVKVFGEPLGISEYGRGQNINNSDGDLLSIFAGLYRPTYHLNCQNIPYDETRLDDWFKTTANDPAGIYLIDAPDRARMDLAINSVKRLLGQCHFVGSGGLTRSLAPYVTAPDTHETFQPPLPSTLVDR